MSRHPNDKTLSEIVLTNVSPIRNNENLDIIKSLTYDEIISSNPSPMQYALYPWLPMPGMAFIYAATGVGKTLFTLNVAYSIAAGGSFLKYKCPKPRKVLYVDGEMSFVEVHSRFMQMVKQQGELSYKENFHLLTPEKALAKLPKISSIEGQEFYNKRIKELEIEVIILDNISTLSHTDDSNPDEWGIIQDWLLNLKVKGISSIVVHHAGKDKKGYRGTSRMLDCLNTAISLQDTSQDQMENEITNSKKFKIEYQKNRGFYGKDAMSFEACLSSNGWEYNSIEQTILEKIVERIKIKMTHKDISIDLGKSRPYISKMAKKARSLGLIDEE